MVHRNINFNSSCTDFQMLKKKSFLPCFTRFICYCVKDKQNGISNTCSKILSVEKLSSCTYIFQSRNVHVQCQKKWSWHCTCTFLRKCTCTMSKTKVVIWRPLSAIVLSLLQFVCVYAHPYFYYHKWYNIWVS